MDFGGRRLAPVLGFEGCDFILDLAPALRVFLAKLIADSLNLKTFEQALFVEFIPRAIAEFFDIPAQCRLIDFPGVPYRLNHVVGLECVTLSFWRNGKIRGREMGVNMRIEGTACVVLKARGTKHTCRHALAVDTERSFFHTSKALQLCISLT